MYIMWTLQYTHINLSKWHSFFLGNADKVVPISQDGQSQSKLNMTLETGHKEVNAKTKCKVQSTSYGQLQYMHDNLLKCLIF